MTKRPPKLSKINTWQPAHVFLLNLAVLALSIIFLCVSLSIQHSNSDAVAPFGGYSQGVSVSAGSALMRVDSVYSTNGTSIFSSPPDKHYLIVALSIKNTSAKPINVFPSSDSYIKDASGNVTFLTPYDLKQPFRAGELLPGEQIKGQLSYLVFKKGSLKLYLDGIWSGGVVPFVVQ